MSRNLLFVHYVITPKKRQGVIDPQHERELKRASSLFIRETGLFPKFWGWAREYSAETVSPELVPRIKQYIANQKEHHKIITFEDEWLASLSESERLKWDMRFFDQ